MAGKFRGLDSDIGWIKREFREVRRLIRESNAAKRLQAATIGAGGITVTNGGYIQSKYASGDDVGLFAGPVNSTPENPAGDGFALNVYTESQSGAQYVVFQASRLPPSGAFPGGHSAIYTSAQQVDVQSEDFSNGVHVDNGQVYLFSDDQVHLYAPNGVTVQWVATGSSANAFIDTDGRIWRSTSSLRYKQDVEHAALDPAAVLNMQPRTWRDKAEVEADPDTERRYVGFIAEELHDIGLGQFVVYDEQGPEAIAYDRLSVALLALDKQQQSQIDDLTKRIVALERAADAEGDV